MSVTTETSPDTYSQAPNRLGGSELLHMQTVQLTGSTAVARAARISDPSAERSRQCMAAAFASPEHYVTTLDRD